MKLTRIYTRGGDKGTTALVGGIRVKKDCVRIESYGTVDELSSHLGLLRAMLSDGQADVEQITDDLQRIQNNLFNVCTYLATDTSQTPVYPSARINPDEIAYLEQQIDRYNESLPILNAFILSGGCMAAAQCHVCRTVCRRAERRIVTLAEGVDNFDADMLRYVNRLSDYLFVLARKLNNIYNHEEKTWQNPCK